MKFLPILLAALLSVSALSTSANAQSFDRRPPGNQPIEVALSFADELGLDQATRDTILQLVGTAREAREPVRSQLHELREQLRVELGLETPDRAVVETLLESIGLLDIELRKIDVLLLIEVRALLTPEQRQILLTLQPGRPPEFEHP